MVIDIHFLFRYNKDDSSRQTSYKKSRGKREGVNDGLGTYIYMQRMLCGYSVYFSTDIKMDNLTIKYIDSGYYDQVIEYAATESSALFSIGEYSSQETQCTLYPNVYSSKNVATISPLHVYTAEELAELNRD